MPGPTPISPDILLSGYNFINSKAEATRAAAEADLAKVTAEQARIAALLAAQAATQAKESVQSLNVSQLMDWVQQINLMVLDVFARPAPWYQPPGISAEMLAARTTLHQVREAALDASQVAAQALQAAQEAKEAVESVASSLAHYTLDTAGCAQFQTDLAAGLIEGNGPVVSREGIPAINPLFFTFKGRDGQRHPIVSGLLADVLNLLNLYPRP